MNLSRDQVALMLNMQNEMNSLVNENWIEAKYPWHTAILAEVVEAINHTGWEWWRHENTDIPQIQMELVDIWHFMLAKFIEAYGVDMSIDLIVSVLDENFEGMTLDDVEYTYAELSGLEKLHLMAALAGLGCSMFPHLIKVTLNDFDMDLQDLFLMYVGKNTLNQFRNRNGYKAQPRTYIKSWFGEEDNVYLSKVLKQVDPKLENLVLKIYDKLQEKYNEVVLYNLT